MNVTIIVSVSNALFQVMNPPPSLQDSLFCVAAVFGVYYY